MAHQNTRKALCCNDLALLNLVYFNLVYFNKTLKAVSFFFSFLFSSPKQTVLQNQPSKLSV